MTCDRDVLVHAFHDGELPEAQRDAVERHVATCDACAELLTELRALTRLMAEVPLPAEADAAPISRYHGAFHKARGQQQRGVLRLSGWLTAAAAIVLAATLLRAPSPPAYQQESVASADLPVWQLSAVTPAAEQEGDRATGPLVVVAQWMADDLAAGGK
jgi:anti-sigma factor RsiW